MKLFISGPMRGVPRYNFPAFDAAKVAFEAVGFEVVTPADLDRAIGFDAMTLPADTDWHAEEGFDVKAAMRRNIDALLDCDGVVFLEGWNHSDGCTIEMLMCERCGMRTVHMDFPYLAKAVIQLWADCARKGYACAERNDKRNYKDNGRSRA